MTSSKDPDMGSEIYMTITPAPIKTSTPVAFDAAELKAVVARLKPLVRSTRYGSPVLQCLRVDFDGEHATLTATDLDNSLKIRMVAPALDAGSFLVPFARLAKVVAAHTKGTITLEGDDETATIRFDRSTVKVDTQPVDEFPRDVVIGNRHARVLNLGCIADVLPAVSRDDTRPILCAVLVEEGRYVSTDSYRLYITDTHDQNTGKFLMARSTAELATKAHKGTVTAYADERHVQIVLDENTTLTGRLVEGEFPPYRSLVPRGDETIIELPATFAADVKKLVKVGVSNDPSTPLRVLPGENGGLRLELRSEGDVTATECGGSTRLEYIAWNPHYLLALIDGMDTNVVYGIDSLKPSVLRDSAPQLGEGVTRTRLIMPVRVA